MTGYLPSVPSENQRACVGLIAYARRNENDSVTALSTSALTMGRDVVQPKQRHKAMMDAKRRMMPFNDASSVRAATRRIDCNPDGPPPLDDAWLDHSKSSTIIRHPALRVYRNESVTAGHYGMPLHKNAP